MKSSTLAVLSVITIAAVGLAFYASRAPAPSAPATPSGMAEGAPMLPGLSGKLNSAASLTIRKGAEEISIARKGDGWVLPAKGGYPAEFEKVKEALVNLADLTVIEPKTANKDFYDQLGVGDPAAPAATARLVTVKDAAGQTLAELIVGNTSAVRVAKPTYFVRRPADAQSWLAQGTLNLDADPLLWVARQILSVDKVRLKSVTVMHAPSGDQPEETVRVFRDSEADTQFLVQDKPADRQLKFETVSDQLTNGLSYLTFDDVKPASEINFDQPPAPPAKKEGEAPPPAPPGPVTAEFRAFDGLVLTARMVSIDGKWWTAFHADYEAPPAPTPAPTPAPDAKPEAAKPDAAAKADAVKKEADDINQRLGPWAFALPEYRAKQIASRMEDLLKPLAPAAPAPGPAGPQPPATDPGADEAPDGPVPLPPK